MKVEYIVVPIERKFVDPMKLLDSESSLLGWFYEVSLIVIINVRSQSPPGLIIKGLDNQARESLIISDNQAFHDASPNLSNSADDSPDQTVDRIKIEYHLPILTIHHTPPGLPGTRLTSEFGVKTNSQRSYPSNLYHPDDG